MRPNRPLRPWLAVALAAVLVLGACGDDSGTAAPGDVDPERCPVDALDDVTAPVTVELWHAMTAENDTTLQALARDYNASQDRVQVRLVFQGTYDETADKYLAALRGGQLPAIVQLEETRLQMAIDSGGFLPAQACVEAAGYDLSDHLEPVLDAFTVEDVLWPMPFNTSTPILYYNTTAFERAGLDVDTPPRTFDEMRSFSEQIVSSGAARSGFSLELSAWYVEQWLAKANETLLDNDNGRTARATEVRLDTPEALAIFEFVVDMINDGLATSVGRNVSGIDSLLALASGDAAMTIETSAALGSVYAVLDEGQFPDVGVGVGPMPGPDEGGVLVGGAALYLVERGASSEQKAAAWDFVRWLNEPEQQARWHAGTGYIPIRKSSVDLPAVADLWAERPGFRVSYDQLVGSTADFGGPVVGPYRDVREAIVTAMERMVLQGVAPADALATAKQEADAAIRSYNARVRE